MNTGDLILAHGIGGRQDLPISLSAALTGAVVALVATFLVLAVSWRRSRFRGAAAGRPLPAAVAGVLDSAVFRWVLRAFGLLAAGWLAVILITGPEAQADNAAPGVLYVLLWIWVPVGSIVFGPIWRAISPLRTLHLLLATASGVDPERGPVRLPRGVGYWPAAAMLALFVWLELVPIDRGEVSTVFVAFVVYAVVMLLGAAVFGSNWFSQADPLEVYSSLAAKLCLIGRRRDGRLVVRSPFNGLDSIPPTPGLSAVVLVLLGSTAFDSLSGSPDWIRMVQDSDSPTMVGTLGLAGSIAIIAAAYALAARATTRLPSGRGELPGLFAHSILPIALGYIVAHYYSLAVLEGQRTLILAADPTGSGDNLLGLTSTDVNDDFVTPTGVATLQVVAVVVGHIIGAVAAHDRAVRLLPPRAAQAGQLPLLLLMVGYTYLGLSLLFSG